MHNQNVKYGMEDSARTRLIITPATKLAEVMFLASSDPGACVAASRIRRR